MPLFKDATVAEEIRSRLESLTHLDLQAFFDSAFVDSPDPDRSLANLERWLRATSNSGTHLAHLQAAPRLARLLMLILGASQSLSDALIQNPELAGVVLDPEQLAQIPDQAAIVDEGRSLLAASNSFNHSLDRLRFLRQRWTLPIVVNDLAGTWRQEQVWLALSDLADALLELALSTVWQDYAAQRGLEPEPPIMVVAFGKLGGHELNYSSDVDLVYVLKDDPEEGLERHAARFCEALGRALAERMGRGSLYRVDLRLRPFGASGLIAPTMKAVEAYYRSHAEPWEAQALVRSRPVAGQTELWPRWEELVRQHCFRPAVSELFIESLIEMRDRIEGEASEDDLKRGPGGIRDVEFLTQVLQIIHGHRHPIVRGRPTVDALRSLRDQELVSGIDADTLIQGYTFLRQLEHRCQLVDDLQTHVLPAAASSREHIARLMGYGDWQHFATQLDLHRYSIRTTYDRILKGQVAEPNDRAQVALRLGEHAAAGLTWLDRLPEPDTFYRILLENESSLDRIARLLAGAPALVARIQDSLPLSEAVLSGEIEEPFEAAQRIEELPVETALEMVARSYSSAWTAVCVRWALDPSFELGHELSALLEAMIRHAARRLYCNFDIVGLGSLAVEEVSPASDADLVFLVSDGAEQYEAEFQAQQLLSVIDRLRRLGAPIKVDLRLRPEGGAGLLVRTYSGLKTYELEAMEMWERFALGNARLIYGSEEAMEVVTRVATALPLTPERLKELIAMKRRIENERVKPQFRRRDVKLGHGGLSDLEWFVHLHEMRFPTATEAGKYFRMPDRIRALCRAKLINAIELEELLEARRHLLDVRCRLHFLGYADDVVPENPDKLLRLAQASGYSEANAFLARHESVIDEVRSIYQEGLERLKA